LERDDQAATRRWRANKPKEMKGNERKIAFISFYFLFGIGTFQWVTGDSNKKIAFPFPVQPTNCRRPSCSPFAKSGHRNTVPEISEFGNKMPIDPFFRSRRALALLVQGGRARARDEYAIRSQEVASRLGLVINTVELLREVRALSDG
jgi:hypothetical protein